MGPFEPTKTRAGHQISRCRTRKIGCVGCLLGYGGVAGGLDEPAELGVSDWVLVHPEIADGNLMDWAFFRVEVPAPMRNRPPGTSTIPFVAVFTTYAPLATTSPKDPFCPRPLHSAGPGTQRRWDGSSAEETLSTRSYRRSRTSPP